MARLYCRLAMARLVIFVSMAPTFFRNIRVGDKSNRAEMAFPGF